MPRKPKSDVLSLFDTLVYTCQYRLVIDPPSNVIARVLEWRQLLRERIGTFNEAYYMPGITLFECELPPEYERALSDAVCAGASGYEPFTMNLGGLTHSEDRKTIYFDLLEKGVVAGLRQRITDHVCANRRIRKLGVEIVERAMLVVASGLKADQFNSAWALLSTQSFSAQQRVSDVVLMKRELDRMSDDQHVRTFALHSMR